MEKETKNIDEIISQFIQWLDEEHGMGCCESDIAITTETAEDYDEACITYKSMYTDKMDDMDVSIIEDSQRYKGEERKNIYILDSGDARLVLAI